MPNKYSTEKRGHAILLRQEGQSLRSVAKTLSISLSTAQLWTKAILLSEEQKLNIAKEHQQKLIKGQKKYNLEQKNLKIERETKIFLEAKNEISTKKKDSFFILGLALYWAEGFKKDHSLGFINSDPIMINVFIKWLKTYGEFELTNLHPRVQIHEIYRSDIKSIEKYWSELLEIPVQQFQAPFFQISKSKPNFIDVKYRGLLRIRISGTREFFVKILGWLEGMKNINY